MHGFTILRFIKILTLLEANSPEGMTTPIIANKVISNLPRRKRVKYDRIASDLRRLYSMGLVEYRRVLRLGRHNRNLSYKLYSITNDGTIWLGENKITLTNKARRYQIKSRRHYRITKC